MYSKMKKAELVALLELRDKELKEARAKIEALQSQTKEKASRASGVRMPDGSIIPYSEYKEKRDAAFDMRQRFINSFGQEHYVARVEGVVPLWKHKGTVEWHTITDATFNSIR